MLILTITTDTAINRLWSLVSGVLLLNSETFKSINNLPLGLIASILVVLLAGLSQTFGQSVMLFINRVRPLRFLLSVAIAAVLFALTPAPRIRRRPRLQSRAGRPRRPVMPKTTRRRRLGRDRAARPSRRHKL